MYNIVLLLCRSETKLCMSSYSIIDSDGEKVAESQARISTIQLMLRHSSILDINEEFTPTYAFVATWHKSIAFPYDWYANETIQNEVCLLIVIYRIGNFRFNLQIFQVNPTHLI